jgi:hypothetical protein
LQETPLSPISAAAAPEEVDDVLEGLPTMGESPAKKVGWSGVKKIAKSTAAAQQAQNAIATTAGNRSYTYMGRLELKHTLDERMEILAELFARCEANVAA